MTKGKDILKSVIADISGKEVDDIEMIDIKNKKVKNKKRKIKTNSKETSYSNKEGLNLDVSDASVVDWKDIKSSRKYFKKKDSLDEWTTFDFFNYTSEVYERIFKKDGFWNLRRGGASLELNKIADLLEDNFGFKTNLMIRDYIDFFFKYFAKKYKSKNNNFYFSQLRKDEVIKSFVDSYNFEESFRRFSDQKENNYKCIYVKDINASYKNGMFYFLLSYGIIIPFNWLLFNKKMNKKDVIKSIMLNLNKAKEENVLDVVLKKTQLYSPYPEWFVFKKIDYLLKSIGEVQKFNIDFVSSSDIDKRYKFMKKGQFGYER